MSPKARPEDSYGLAKGRKRGFKAKETVQLRHKSEEEWLVGDTGRSLARQEGSPEGGESER